ncbi:NGG1p interacting factor NIF3 [Granulosicoccaceae sp. 1_MG-2023]|nr:NGG1p interacting factor NIF3 [Granulosicoccaceae sp. 1_MG-2023]
MNACQLVVYIPCDHTEAVKRALFAAGAGDYGNYDSCAWQVSGTGQFRPLAGADPFIGRPGEIEKVAEDRVEMLCQNDRLPAIIAALREAHPYEVPAFHIIPLLDPDQFDGA